MGIVVLYFVVVLLSNTIGALSGIGGGVIIKPALDAVGAHDLTNISFFSGVAVFVMAVVSLFDQFKSGFKVKVPPTLAIALGSVVGGILGNYVFQGLLTIFPNQEIVLLVQIILTVISLALVLLYLKLPIQSLHIKNLSLIFLVGLFLAFLSTLLGIGGGPINVIMFMYCFSMTMKEASVYSIVTIFFSQLSKLTTIALVEGFGGYELNILWVIILASIIGGLWGAKLNQKMSEAHIMLYYSLGTFGVILLNIVNGVLLLF